MDKFYKDLALSIIGQAVKEYDDVLRKLIKDPLNWKFIARKNEIKDFFEGDWCDSLCSAFNERIEASRPGKLIERKIEEKIIKEEIKKLRAKSNLRIRLHHMDDVSPVEAGSYGTITSIDDFGQLHVSWDNGETDNVVIGKDVFEIITKKSIKKAIKGLIPYGFDETLLRRMQDFEILSLKDFPEQERKRYYNALTVFKYAI